ncbi:sel1 repeat family protein [Pseudomonadales bacterium]|nr:sel1 repeat family protein [Pseudomonadales bacterium]
MLKYFIPALVLVIMGCQNTASKPSDTAPLPGTLKITQSSEAEIIGAINERKNFLENTDLIEKLPSVLAFERQALQLLNDQPLRLGAIGAAIIELRPGSLTGHYALKKFYQHVETPEGVATHATKLNHLYAALLQSGDGSQELPYEITTKNDAAIFALLQNKRIVGEIYQTTQSHPLGLLTLARANASSPLEDTVFDLSDLLEPLSQLNANEEAGSPWPVLRLFTDEEDSAAQASIGTYLAKQQRYDSATGWLELSARNGNMLAHTLLARIYGYLAEVTDKAQSGSAVDRPFEQPFDQNKRRSSDQSEDQRGDQSREQPREQPIERPGATTEEFTLLSIKNHRQAIALGSVESMYTLGRLLIESTSNKPPLQRNIPEGVEFMERAGSLGSARAYLFLAYQNASGKLLERNDENANKYFAAAAQLKNPTAVINYARFLVSFNELEPHEQLVPLLTELASQDNAKAMVALGNLNALGIGSKKSTRQAVSWYKKAVRVAQASHHEAADVINEVAWTLASTQDKPLQRSRYAQKIMDALMEKNPQASTHPEYLDTWANTYAANGDFSKAISLQKQAIASASAQNRSDILKILNDHLAQFMAGQAITEQTP